MVASVSLSCPVQKFLCRRRRKDARPAEIAAAALAEFAEKGFNASRIDDIAARAGVSKGTVYLYFDSKEALFKSAVETSMTPALEAVEALVADRERAAAELLQGFVIGWWRMVGATPLAVVPKLMMSESGNFPELARWFYEHMVLRVHRAVAGIIELGIRRGEFRDMEAMTAARVVMAPLFALIVWRRALADVVTDMPDPEVFLATAVDTFVHGFTSPRPIE